MNAEVLLVIPQLASRVNKQEQKIKRLRELQTRTTQELRDMPRSDSLTSKIEKLSVEIVELEKEVEELARILAEMRTELAMILERQIGEWWGEAQTLLLRYGYCYSYQEIARRLGYARPSIYRFHSYGLKLLNVPEKDVLYLQSLKF